MSPAGTLDLIGITLISFLAVLLLTSTRYRSPAHRFLAGALISLALLLLRISGDWGGSYLVEVLDIFRLEYLFAPLLYLYGCTSIGQSTSLRQYFVLFAPFVCFSSFYALVEIGGAFDAPYLSNVLEKFEPFEVFVIIVFNILVLWRLTATVRGSSVQPVFKRWMTILSGGLILILLGFLLLEGLEGFFDLLLWNWINTLIALFFVLLSYLGVQQLPGPFSQQKRRLRKRRGEGSPQSKTANRFQQIQMLVERRELFRDPNLDRETLAAALGLSPSSVTRILKEEGAVTFTDFINRYRVNLSKTLLKQEAYEHLSLEAIGQEVGFRSRSTFYAAFKKEVGCSPGNFKTR
ncbi:MAG: helix-turn-helix transcriptional regulator [Bacteroidota bacterium]